MLAVSTGWEFLCVFRSLALSLPLPPSPPPSLGRMPFGPYLQNVGSVVVRILGILRRLGSHMLCYVLSSWAALCLGLLGQVLCTGGTRISAGSCGGVLKTNRERMKKGIQARGGWERGILIVPATRWRAGYVPKRCARAPHLEHLQSLVQGSEASRCSLLEVEWRRSRYFCGTRRGLRLRKDLRSAGRGG